MPLSITAIGDVLVAGLACLVPGAALAYSLDYGATWTEVADEIDLDQPLAATLWVTAANDRVVGVKDDLIFTSLMVDNTSLVIIPRPRIFHAVITDVDFFHSLDGGNIEIINGVSTMSDGLEAAVYLSLFGGNIEDSGDEAESSLQWWGNLGETDPARQYRSEFQYLIQTLPATSGNLGLMQSAAERDVTRTLGAIATAISAVASIPAVNRVLVEITIEIDGSIHKFNFNSQWGGTE